MTGARKQADRRAALWVAVVSLAFCLSAMAPLPGTAATVLPPGVEATLRQAAERDADAFRVALRQAIAAAPGRKDEILRYALTAHPQRSAELLLAGLFMPPLQPPAAAPAPPPR